jgi:H+/Cl- antiporter ClcA
MHGPPTRQQLPGVILAALATLIFGAALGPEMPLILLGGGLAALAVRLARRPVPDRARAVVASAGSFAAISTLLGSPLVGAFLLMEASSLGGPMLGLVLLPGLLAAGVGSRFSCSRQSSRTAERYSKPMRATAVLGCHPHTHWAAPLGREQGRAGSLHPEARGSSPLSSTGQRPLAIRNDG